MENDNQIANKHRKSQRRIIALLIIIPLLIILLWGLFCFGLILMDEPVRNAECL